MPAGLLDAVTILPDRFAEAERGEEPLESSRLCSKHNRRQEIKICRREGFSRRYPRARGRGFTHRWTNTQARSRIHARRLTRADTRTHSDAHLLVPRPSGAPLVCGGEGRRPLRSAHKQASLGLLAPTKLFFFVAVNFPGPRVYLFPKLNPVTKPNLKRWNNQCRLLQSMAPCASWN